MVRDRDNTGNDALGNISGGGYFTQIAGHLDGVAILDATFGGRLAVDPGWIVMLDLDQPLTMCRARVRVHGNLEGGQV